jgi:hypothetical protein
MHVHEYVDSIYSMPALPDMHDECMKHAFFVYIPPMSQPS